MIDHIGLRPKDWNKPSVEYKVPWTLNDIGTAPPQTHYGVVWEGQTYYIVSAMYTSTVYIDSCIYQSLLVTYAIHDEGTSKMSIYC